MRRLTFSTLIGNGDMHLKNWSLIYPDRRTAALSPAYDFASTIPYIKGDRFALNYSVFGILLLMRKMKFLICCESSIAEKDGS